MLFMMQMNTALKQFSKIHSEGGTTSWWVFVRIRSLFCKYNSVFFFVIGLFVMSFRSCAMPTLQQAFRFQATTDTMLLRSSAILTCHLKNHGIYKYLLNYILVHKSSSFLKHWLFRKCCSLIGTELSRNTLCCKRMSSGLSDGRPEVIQDLRWLIIL